MDIEVKGLSFRDPAHTNGIFYKGCITARLHDKATLKTVSSATSTQSRFAKTVNYLDNQELAADDLILTFLGLRGGLHGRAILSVAQARELGMAMVAWAEGIQGHGY